MRILIACVLVLAGCDVEISSGGQPLVQADPPVLSFTLSAAAYRGAELGLGPVRATPATAAGMSLAVPLHEDEILRSVILDCTAEAYGPMSVRVIQTALGSDFTLVDAVAVVAAHVWAHYEFTAAPLIVLPVGDALTLHVSGAVSCGNARVRYEAAFPAW